MKKLIFILIGINTVFSSFSQYYTEDFENNQIADDTTFTSNGRLFNLGNGWNIENVSTFGVFASDWYIDDYETCPNTGLVGSISTDDGKEIFINSAWFYISNDCDFNNNGSIKVYWYNDGIEVHNETYSILFTDPNISSGFSQINFDQDGNSCIAADELKFEILGDLNYLAMDNFTWSNNMTRSSIDTLESNINDICPSTSVSLNTKNLLLGNAATLNWYDQPNGNGNLLGTAEAINVTPNYTTTYYARISGTCNTIETSIDINVLNIDTSITLDVDTLKAIKSIDITYQWLDCDNNNTPVPGAINHTYTPTQAGNYSVEYKFNSCKDTSNCYIVDYVLSFDDQNTQNIYISPNPAQDEIILHCTNSNSSINNVGVINQLGIKQHITVSEIGNRNYRIDISNLPRGLYLINFNEENQNNTLRFIIN